MGNKSKLLGQRWFFPEMYKSHVYTISSAVTNQNAKLIHPLKIETKIRHACLEFHLQLNITYSYFADESFKPSHVIKYKIQKSDELHRELYLFARCINISRLVGNGPAKNTSISLPVHFTCVYHPQYLLTLNKGYTKMALLMSERPTNFPTIINFTQANLRDFS